MSNRRWRPAVALLCSAACGCSVMRELPRSEYARLAERRDVRIETRGGERLEFDRIQLGADSLTGYQRKEVRGPFEEFRSVRLGLDEVARMSVRAVDWYRTGLVGGTALAVVLAVVLTQAKGSSDGSSSSGPCGGRPCP